MKIDPVKMAKGSVLGACGGIVFSSLLIFIMAAILSIGHIPSMVIEPMALVSLALGGIFGGFLAGKAVKEKGFLCGMISGILFFLVVWCCGGVFGIGDFGMKALLKSAILIFAGILGGIIGVNRVF